MRIAAVHRLVFAQLNFARTRVRKRAWQFEAFGYPADNMDAKAEAFRRAGGAVAEGLITARDVGKTTYF
jgi:hypothetical protein